MVMVLRDVGMRFEVAVSLDAVRLYGGHSSDSSRWSGIVVGYNERLLQGETGF